MIRKPRSLIQSRLGSLPMTSMIDVVFLLLIFFMVTANFASDEDRLSSALKTDQQGASSSALRPQVLTVDQIAGRTVFRIGEHATSSREDLLAVLKSLPKEQGIAVKVTDAAPISAAATAMQLVHEAGFQKRSYVPTTSTNP